MSTVRGIIEKWKRLGTAATQPWSRRPRKATEWGHRSLRSMLCCESCADSMAKEIQTGINISTKNMLCDLHMIFDSLSASYSPNNIYCMQKSNQCNVWLKVLTSVEGVMNMLFSSMSTGRREEGAIVSNSVFNTPNASWESRCICQAHRYKSVKHTCLKKECLLDFILNLRLNS